ncbi:hypothetical protein FHX42_004670 [Saccharopolyspora lacisalsi]|uniref:PRC-barrel domain-containing protein n=1 Tax=Halosaccharopolyspora lacisalsi TaxID=1000566 RepID=A0A839E3Z1_9PSEU|nr:PRC-barrel domain-containing protein [Halosaccharopolyspora lacisalsi]MBA8827286.1 hypothetical protein [Halosaccharopolyspora lacisalsi]
MIGQREALRLFGCEVFDPVGQRIGIIGELFLDDVTEQPAWVTVQTGLFGTNESFVPLEGAAFDGDTVTVAVSREAVRHAPQVPLEQGNLPPERERELYLHYGLEYGIRPADITPAAESDSAAESDPAPEYVDAVRSRLRRWIAAS